MTAFRDSLHTPAAFRGVPFRWKDADKAGGRRAVVYEYPLRDTPFTEDLGRKAKRYSIKGYTLFKDAGAPETVTGDANKSKQKADGYFSQTDYTGQRDALVQALEKSGPGTLMHPYLGPLKVQVLSYKTSETTEDGGVCHFEMEFVEAGGNASPTAETDTASTTIAAAQDTKTKAMDAFVSSFTVQYYPTIVNVSAYQMMVEIYAQTLGFLSNIGFDLSAVGIAAALVYASAAALLDVVGVATAIAGVFSSVADAVTSPLLSEDGSVSSTAVSTASLVGSTITSNTGNVTVPFTTTSYASSSRQPLSTAQNNADPTYGLGAFATYGSTMAAVPLTTAARQQQARNQAIMIILVQASALSAIATVFAQSVFTSSKTAEDALTNFITWSDSLLATIDSEMQAGNIIDDSLDQLFMSVNQLATFVSLDINSRASQLPKTSVYNSHTSLPALALSQLLYQSSSNDTVLVSLNDFPHPLFCAPSGLAVVS